MTILEAQNLTHVFPDGTVGIKDINLKINEGDFLIIAGTNGSGKTVLIRHFNGLLFPTSGKVLFEGVTIKKNLTNVRKGIGLIFQDSNSQFVGQTVAEDVAFGPENLKLSPKDVKERVDESLALVGLEHLANQRPQLLSGGQKRKLAVAGVLAMRPKIIILDEPFTGLDYPGVVQVLNQIIALHKDGHTIILVTHELDKVLAHSNRLVLMDKGKIVKDGPPNEIIEGIEQYGIRIPCAKKIGVEAMTWLS